MISVFEFDEFGFYTISYRVMKAEEIQHENYLLDSPYSFLKAKVNDIATPTHWVEGATSEEIKASKSLELMPQLQKVFSDNELKAKAFVIDKNGKKAYIESQERHYVLKYKVAKGLITNAKITALHEIEAADLGITLEQLHYVIVWKYETAEAEFENISACNETCRCRIQTHLEQEQWQKFESCMAIYQNLICEDYELLTNQLLAI